MAKVQVVKTGQTPVFVEIGDCIVKSYAEVLAEANTTVPAGAKVTSSIGCINNLDAMVDPNVTMLAISAPKIEGNN